MKLVKGYLFVINGDCTRNESGIYNAFIPCANKKKAIHYVEGNGDIIGILPYEVDLDSCKNDEKECIIDRMINLQ